MRHLVRVLILAAALVSLPALATITHGGSNANVTAAGGSSTATPTIPAGAGTGDALIVPAFVTGDNAGEAITTPTDWTLLHTVTQGVTGKSITLYVFCKIHDGSEANPALATTGTGTGDNVGGEVYYIESSGTGFDCANIEAHANQQGNAAGLTLPHPALTITTPNTYVLAFGVKTDCESCDYNQLATGSLGWTQASDSAGTAGDDWSMTGDYLIQTTATNIPSGAWTLSAGDESQISASIVISLQEIPAASSPDFDVAPALVSCDGDSCDLSYDANADADRIHCMALATNESTPAASAIEAQTGSNGYATEATTGSSDTITVPLNVDSPVFPLYNFHCAVEEGTSNYSAVSSVLAAEMDAPTGRTFWPILSIGSGSPCEDFNAATDPDIAANDWLLSDDATDPGTYAATWANTCQVSYTGDTSRQSLLNTAVYDASAGGYHADDIDFWMNDPLIVVDNELPQVLLLNQNEAMSPIDMDNLFSHPIDQLTYTVTTGTINSGLTLTEANGEMSGTPDTEDEDGNGFTVTATSLAGQTADLDWIVIVVDTWTVPEIINMTPLEAAGEICAAAIWRCEDPGLSATFSYSDTVPSGDIISQDPAATTEIGALDLIDVVVSLGQVPVGTLNPFGFTFDFTM